MMSARQSLRAFPLLLEAAALLVFFRIAIRILPFRWLVAWITPPDDVVAPNRRLALVGRVRWAIQTVAAKSPLAIACLSQALAAYFMLKRRHVAATMFYGVAKSGPKLEAHTWLKAGEDFVVGGEWSSFFTPVTSFPNADAKPLAGALLPNNR
jgi:hypothetical protein